jgi:hypothetical protein
MQALLDRPIVVILVVGALLVVIFRKYTHAGEITGFDKLRLKIVPICGNSAVAVRCFALTIISSHSRISLFYHTSSTEKCGVLNYTILFFSRLSNYHMNP